jgi:hypothetical protein
MALAVGALGLGAVFGASTSAVNAAAQGTVDLESREATTSGWSILEVVSILLDSGWAWAGLAIIAGLLAARRSPQTTNIPLRGALAGMLALVAATTAYFASDTVFHDVAVDSYGLDIVFWWVASVLFGMPLGAIGACATRPGPVGLLARLTVPAGASVQMLLIPPGRNDVLMAIGQGFVWTASAVCVTVLALHYVRHRDHTPMRTSASSLE